MQNATITIENKTTHEHRTFRIATAKAMEGKQILALLNGPDNTSDYEGFAFIDDTGVKLWSRYKESKAFKYYALLIETLLGVKANNIPVERYTIAKAARCMRCNRVLTTPESIARGIGPECATL